MPERKELTLCVSPVTLEYESILHILHRDHPSGPETHLCYSFGVGKAYVQKNKITNRY